VQVAIVAEMSNSFPMGNEFPQVATRIAYGFGRLWFDVMQAGMYVSRCLATIMHIMHGPNLHMHGEDRRALVGEFRLKAGTRRGTGDSSLVGPFPSTKRSGTAPRNRLSELSCFHCNSFKGSNIGGRDAATLQFTPLFNPQRHKWSVISGGEGPYLVGRTLIGRVTIDVLNINDRLRVELRSELIEEGIFL
jgi:hypothetical protein